MRFGVLTTLTRVALVVAAAGSLEGLARAQGHTQSTPAPERVATTEDEATPVETPATNTASGGGVGLPFTRLLDLFGPGQAEIDKRFRIASTDFGSRRFAENVSGNALFGTVNPNAPWKVGGGFTFSTANGTIARIGVVGYRNYQMPLFMSQAIGSGQDLTLPLVSFTDLSNREMQWEISAGVEKTFIRAAGGVTIGAVADIFVPLNQASPARSAPDTQVPPSITIRGGVKVGF